MPEPCTISTTATALLDQLAHERLAAVAAKCGQKVRRST